MRTSDRQWQALLVKPRFEQFVALLLRDRDYECYLPLRCSKTAQVLHLPLFPAYVFSKFSSLDWAVVRLIPGVNSLTDGNERTAKSRQRDVATLQRIIGSGLPYGRSRRKTTLAPNAAVTGGILRGLTGYLAHSRKTSLLVVHFEWIPWSVYVEVKKEKTSRIEGLTYSERVAS